MELMKQQNTLVKAVQVRLPKLFQAIYAYICYPSRAFPWNLQQLMVEEEFLKILQLYHLRELQ